MNRKRLKFCRDRSTHDSGVGRHHATGSGRLIQGLNAFMPAALIKESSAGVYFRCIRGLPYRLAVDAETIKW